MNGKNDRFHQGMIAGTHSSVGKTLWTLAVIGLARKNGFCVQPFKTGPDYIDTGFHHRMCAPRKSRNLDLFLLSPEKVKEIYRKNIQGAVLALVEGVMGLFDGRGAGGEEGSSAQLAKLLDLPVFLVIDGSNQATSAAATVLGFQKFDSRLTLTGILINRVKNEGHFTWLKKAIEGRTGIPCLGYLPPEELLCIPERHLGLTTAVETRENVEKITAHAVRCLETRFDWQKFLELTQNDRPLRFLPDAKPAPGFLDQRGRDVRIAVAYDTAFSFYYEDNLDLLKQKGAELVFFSPLQDEHFPENIDLLYLGGGFPEIYTSRLAKNKAMIRDIRNFYKQGGFIYAECGGFIYLTEFFVDPNGNKYPLVGLIPGEISMTDRLQGFGYHELEAVTDSFLFSKGQRLRSHEFHYSAWRGPETFQPAYRVNERLEGFVADRLVASYQHLHFASEGIDIRAMLDFCRRSSAPGSTREVPS